jgi:hypothetical protein
MNEGATRLLKQVGAVLVLDQTTLDDVVKEYSGFAFPPEHVIVVPAETVHTEQAVYTAAVELKVKLCKGPLTPEQEHAFTHCSGLCILVVDGRRHVNKKLNSMRSCTCSGLFKFDRGKGKGNENEFAIAQKTDDGHVWVLEPLQLVLLLCFLGSAQALAPQGTKELRDLVFKCLRDVQVDVHRVRTLAAEATKKIEAATRKIEEAAVPAAATQKSTTFDNESQVYVQDNTAETRDKSNFQVSACFAAPFRHIISPDDAHDHEGLGKRLLTSTSDAETQRGSGPDGEGSREGGQDKRARVSEVGQLSNQPGEAVVGAAQQGQVASEGAGGGGQLSNEPVGAVGGGAAQQGQVPVEGAGNLIVQVPVQVAEEPDLFMKCWKVGKDALGRPQKGGSFGWVMEKQYSGDIYAACKHLCTIQMKNIFVDDASWALLPKHDVKSLGIEGAAGGAFQVPPQWEHLKFSGQLVANPLGKPGSRRIDGVLTVTDRRFCFFHFISLATSNQWRRYGRFYEYKSTYADYVPGGC